LIAVMPVAIGGLSAFLALFPALATALAHLVWRPGGAERILVLAGAWTLLEWLRGWVLTGFPWNPMGLVLAPFDAPLQIAALVGVFGLSLLVVAVAGLPVLLLDALGDRAQPSSKPLAPPGILRLAVGLPVLALLIGGAIWGQMRLADHPDPARYALAPGWAADPPAEPATILRLVQPSISQKDKWRRDQALINMDQYVALSKMPGWLHVDAVIWGETAIPAPVNEVDFMRLSAARAAPPSGLLISGGLRLARTEAGPKVWNALFVLDGQGRVRDSYNKTHLVPFGEYVPLRGALPLEHLLPGTNDFSFGDGLRTLMGGTGVGGAAPRLPGFSPLICYEAIFPGAVTAAEGDRPDWLLNITNDGWYGDSTGPYQHLELVRLRAIEEGLPFIRVANTGISGAYDGLGRGISSLGYEKNSALDLILPPPLNPPLYVSWGNAPTVILGFLFIFIGFLLRRMSVKQESI
ncbi:MAG: apolipoprotein N-acyltransferase, partial [Rhodospirillaceae bacterium]